MNPQTVIYTNPEYAAVNEFNAELKRMGIDPSSVVISPKTLAVNLPLSASKSTYEFNLRETPSADRSDDIKLNFNDLFLGVFMALIIRKQNASNQTGNSLPFTYPDPQYFLGVSGGVNEWDCLNTVYNGKLTIQTDDVVRLKDYDTREFLYIPEKQVYSADGGTLNPQTNDELHGYGPSMAEKGYQEFLVRPFFYGPQNHIAKLTLGEGDRSVIAGGVNGAGAALSPVTTNVVTLLIKGLVASNAIIAQGGRR